MSHILVVCTGNICRSPLAEGFLRQLLDERFGRPAVTVSSAGISGWEGSPAHPDSVRAGAERDVDISGHVARRLVRDHLDRAHLVLAMAGEHAEGVRRLAPDAAAKTFTLKELVRLLEARPTVAAQGPPGPDLLRRRVAEAAELRASGFEGNPYDEDVSDPLGLPPETFRAVAWELQDWCARLVNGVYGKVPARTSMWDPDE
ncbi:MAG: low molecular weight phosphatase family protein [Actinobacteria bacterium]|nr:low molecular weight phosphatase family protein [Actinomycetota bacterium]